MLFAWEGFFILKKYTIKIYSLLIAIDKYQPVNSKFTYIVD